MIEKKILNKWRGTIDAENVRHGCEDEEENKKDVKYNVSIY